ncbi:MAG: DUF3327 domain-containing protein [Thermoplasmata archaeon]|nr:DUF3327 domain-containing protein [Thermoplasmata archaeon]
MNTDLSTPFSPQSPTLARLFAQVDRLGPAPIEEFWTEVSEAGTPLIEERPSGGRSLLVTFLWRPEQNFERAFVSSNLFQPGPSSAELSRLAGSDIWFRTETLSRSLRGSYSFHPGMTSPAKTEDEFYEWVWRNERPDPHHPGVVTFPKIPTDPGDVEVVRSVLELPGAAPQPYVARRSDVARGALQSHEFQSSILGAPHPIWVYLPPGYSADGPPCDLLILFDGRNYGNAIPTPTIMDNMLAESLLDPAVVVLWDYPRGQLRNQELECNPLFAVCMEKELVPWIRDTYRVTNDPSRTVVGGASAGGLGATYVAWRYPATFGKVLSQSGWFGCAPSGVHGPPGWMPTQFANGPVRPIEFYLEAGSAESGPSAPEVEILPTNRAFRALLESNGYVVHYAEFEGGHEWVNWRGTLSDGLRAVLPKKAAGH